MKKVYLFLLSLLTLTVSCRKVISIETNIWKKTSNLSALDSATHLIEVGGVIFAGTSNNGVFISYDTGTSWLPLQNGLPANAQISSFAKTATGELFCTVYLNGTYKLKNNVWEKFKPAPGYDNVPDGAEALHVSNNTLFAEHNPGISFTDITNESQWNHSSSWMGAISSFAENKNTGQLYAGGQNGFFFSTNNGITWDSANIGLPKGTWINTLVHSGDKIFAGTLENGIYVSENKLPLSWKKINNAFLHNKQIFCFATTPTGTIFASALDGGIWRSDDDGITWREWNVGLPSERVFTSLVIVGTKIFVTTDEGIFVRNT